MKYLIVGLGNIGDEYRDTRHNIGFNVVDAMAKDAGVSFADRRYGSPVLHGGEHGHDLQAAASQRNRLPGA